MNKQIIRDIILIVGLVIIGLYNYYEFNYGVMKEYNQLEVSCLKQQEELNKKRFENRILMAEICSYERKYGKLEDEYLNYGTILYDSTLLLKKNNLSFITCSENTLNR